MFKVFKPGHDHIGQMFFFFQSSKVRNSTRGYARITVRVLCMSSNGNVYLYKVS